jgi:hypothetical protein
MKMMAKFPVRLSPLTVKVWVADSVPSGVEKPLKVVGATVIDGVAPPPEMSLN